MDGPKKCQDFLQGSNPSPLFLPPRPPWRGAHSCLRGQILTSGYTRFCCESSNCRNFALFVGQIIKYARQIILRFGSNGPSSNKNSDSNLNQINLIYALLSQIQLCRDYALFEGHFCPKCGDGGHQNSLMDRGSNDLQKFN